MTRGSISIHDLAEDAWIRPHDGSAARLLDHVLQRHGLQPPLHLAGRGEEPAEAQALVAAGRGVMLAHDLNVIINPDRIAVRAAEEDLPCRKVQGAIMRGQRAPGPRAVLQALREVGQERAERLKKSS